MKANSVVVLTESKNIALHLRQLLATYNWTILLASPKPLAAVGPLMNGEASMLIVDDYASAPAILHLRQLMRQPFFFSTPIIVLLSEDHARERGIISKMADICIVDKPLSPGSFLPQFWKQVRRWETAPLSDLRQSLKSYHDDPSDTKHLVQQWHGLLSKPVAGTFAVSTLASILLQAGDLMTAEKLLLQSIKAKTANLGTVLMLVDMYLDHAMPVMARKLLMYSERLSTGLSLVPDMIQTDLMLGEWDWAAKRLNLLISQGFLVDYSQRILNRIIKLSAAKPVGANR